jgi:hypothetical protein
MPLKWTILLKIGHFPDGRFSFVTADAVLYWIKSFFESSWYRIESNDFGNYAIKNLIESKGIKVQNKFSTKLFRNKILQEHLIFSPRFFLWKQVGELNSNIGVILNRSWLPLSENPNHHPQKRTVNLGDAFEGTAFKPGFEITKY